MPEGAIQELREDFSARTPNSAKCSGDSGLDTRVNGCPVQLDFRIKSRLFFIIPFGFSLGGPVWFFASAGFFVVYT